MKLIDRETVQRITDSAEIVDVVSDFVALKRRGSNYIGLCPFHNERTPSFSVSPSRNYCKCFSCGKGGSPVGFVMEHEQMTYNEALRYLAKKYNIEIREQEQTEEERREETARENMFAANEFALTFFENTLTDTDEGRDVGLSYFRERGINDEAIHRYHLGYSPAKSGQLIAAAKAQGYNLDYFVDSGLLVRRDDGDIYERFRGRVIYPVHTISGKVVAFGGRILSNDKTKAKYVNSPESVIYSKSHELYGLYQAKAAIVKKRKCILVEGYMDVISMSQRGIQNVVASSGTSLTQGQIRLIHRFTDTVTVIYDSDPAGIKASLRGIDMLLQEGLNIKVVLLPEGDDPDSFAQSHTSDEVERYIDEHEQDFIRFKTEILMADATDPILRSQVINDIVRSISVIPDDVVRAVYVQECSRMMDLAEHVLLKQVTKLVTEQVEQNDIQQRKEQALASIGFTDATSSTTGTATTTTTNSTASQASVARTAQSPIFAAEAEIVRLAIKYGMVGLPMVDENDRTITISILDYIVSELAYDSTPISTPILRHALDACLALADTSWEADLTRFTDKSLAIKEQAIAASNEQIQAQAQTLDDIRRLEGIAAEKAEADHVQRLQEFADYYLIRALASSPDDDIRRVVNELATSKHRLSKMHSRLTKIETERDRLTDIVPRAIMSLRDAIISLEITNLRSTLAGNPDPQQVSSVMARIVELDNARKVLGASLGERVVIPRRQS